MAAESSSFANPDGPRVLILGGCGFVGRNLVRYLADHKLVSFIKVCDKKMPALVYMSEEHMAPFKDKAFVKYQQCDLSRAEHVNDRAFNEDVPFDFVFNLCGETRFGMPEDEYHKTCVLPAQLAGAAALAMGVRRFVEVSTAQVYKASKSASDENDELDPWTIQAKCRLEAEKQLQALAKDGLPLVIVRPSTIYGPGDQTGITPRITCAVHYQADKSKMKFLWSKDLRLNTVHVSDVVRALWVAATEAEPGKIYNLSDAADTTQGQVNDVLGKIFGIKTGFLGTIVSKLASVNLEGVADHSNDMHVPGFAEVCQKHNILNTPLSPYLDKELLRNNHLAVDGRRITKETSFEYEHSFNEDLVRAQINQFIEQGIFPPVV